MAVAHAQAHANVPAFVIAWVWRILLTVNQLPTTSRKALFVMQAPDDIWQRPREFPPCLAEHSLIYLAMALFLSENHGPVDIAVFTGSGVTVIRKLCKQLHVYQIASYLDRQGHRKRVQMHQ